MITFIFLPSTWWCTELHWPENFLAKQWHLTNFLPNLYLFSTILSCQLVNSLTFFLSRWAELISFWTSQVSEHNCRQFSRSHLGLFRFSTVPHLSDTWLCKNRITALGSRNLVINGRSIKNYDYRIADLALHHPLKKLKGITVPRIPGPPVDVLLFSIFSWPVSLSDFEN